MAHDRVLEKAGGISTVAAMEEDGTVKMLVGLWLVTLALFIVVVVGWAGSLLALSRSELVVDQRCHMRECSFLDLLTPAVRGVWQWRAFSTKGRKEQTCECEVAGFAVVHKFFLKPLYVGGAKVFVES